MNKNGLIYTLIFSFIVTFIFVVPLSFANELVKDRVAENAVIAKAAAVLKAFGQPVNKEDREGTKAAFAKVNLIPLERLTKLGQQPPQYKLITPEEAAALKASNPISYIEVFETQAADGTPVIGKFFTGTGLWGPIELMLTFDKALTRINGIAVLSHAETPGLGARIDEAWYQEMVSGEVYVDGKIVMDSLPKDRTDNSDGKIDVITGATRTSEGMAAVYNQAYGDMKAVLAALPQAPAAETLEAQP